MKLSFTGLNVALVLLLVPSLALGLDPSIDGTTGCFRRLNQTTGNDRQCNASLLEYLGENTTNNMSGKWGVEFPYGDVTGLSVCSTLESTSNTVATASEESILNNEYDNLTSTGVLETGQIKCWCKMTGPLSGRWVYKYSSGQSSCQSECPFYCENGVRTDAVFREALFSAVPPSVVTTQTYVDNLLSGKQAKITTTGTNKLMTFGNGAGAAPGSRDIVSTLGTSTTATTVPETGPIVAGINSKQDTVNGIAGRVMAGTGTAGLLDDKLIYTAPLGFTSSLVTAQTVNSIAADAANNELTCATYATPGNTSSECLLWQINTDSATKVKVLEPKKGTGYCYKSSNGNQSLTACTVENKGEWGVVFPDYTVYGIAMCSSHAIPKNGNASIKGYVPNVQYQQFIQDEYDTWVANGRPDSFNGAYCYCKITTPSGSRWVGFHYGTPQLRTCLNGCSLYCGNSLRLNESSESAFINALYRP